MSTVVRTGPRKNGARNMTRAMAIPSTSSIATEITAMKTVLNTDSHHSGALSTVT